MKNYILPVLLILLSGHCFSQNVFNLYVKGKYIKVWENTNTATPVQHYLSDGEQIRFVNAPTSFNDGEGGNKQGYRIYRNGNTKPYYVSMADCSADLYSKQLFLKEGAVGAENTMPYLLSLNDDYVKYKPGQVIFVHASDYYGYKATYTNINRSAIASSSTLDKRFYGFYKITSIQNYKVQNGDKYYFLCEPVASPFNNLPGGENIYVDPNAVTDYTLQSVDYETPLTDLLINYAYDYPAGPAPAPEDFYTSYLNLLYGGTSVQGMNEFEQHKLLSDGKEYIDSIFRLRNTIFKHHYLAICKGQLSEYDFNNGCFHINEMGEDSIGGVRLFHRFDYYSTYKNGAAARCIFFGNDFLYTDEFKINADFGAKLIEKISAYNQENRQGERIVVLVPFYRYITDNEANTLHYEKRIVADSIQVYDSPGLGWKWGTLYPRNR